MQFIPLALCCLHLSLSNHISWGQRIGNDTLPSPSRKGRCRAMGVHSSAMGKGVGLWKGLRGKGLGLWGDYEGRGWDYEGAMGEGSSAMRKGSGL